MTGVARVDLNADVGESYGVWTLGHNAELMRWVSSVNIACGVHAGDATVMRRTARLAVEGGLAIGAHPGLPDRQGFGRREMTLPPGELEDLVLYQVAALAGVVVAEGGRLRHVKPHGALYTMAARDPDVAAPVVAGVRAFDATLAIVGPPSSALLAAAAAAQLPARREGFVDRAYQPDGSLVPRTDEGAVLESPEAVVRQAVGLVRDGQVVARDGSVLPLTLDTICLHGDTREAVRLAAAVRAGLAHAGVSVEA